MPGPGQLWKVRSSALRVEARKHITIIHVTKQTLGIQIAQSRYYLHTSGPRAGVVYTVGSLEKPRLHRKPARQIQSGQTAMAFRRLPCWLCGHNQNQEGPGSLPSIVELGLGNHLWCGFGDTIPEWRSNWTLWRSSGCRCDLQGGHPFRASQIQP